MIEYARNAMTLKVSHFSSDQVGGAGRAALRLHRSLQFSSEVHSKIFMQEKVANTDSSMNIYEANSKSQMILLLKKIIDDLPKRLQSLSDDVPRSCGWASIYTAQDINMSDSDIIHLHWINKGFLSIEQIGKITKPVVWTLHDMWPFCGAEHLVSDDADARWRQGYDRLENSNTFDIDRWVWERKKAQWINPITIVAPSRWMANCVRESSLMANYPIAIIPNPLDTDTFKSMNKAAARQLMNLPMNKKLVLFGAIEDARMVDKGWDLLKPALIELSKQGENVDLVIFGQSKPTESLEIPMQVHWMGHISDDYSLAALYSAVDLFINPSRQESFGQTASEAQACGCPVVAFDTAGLRDVVENNVTGLLVNPKGFEELTIGILKLMQNENLRIRMGEAGQERAKNLWAYPMVNKQYIELYKKI